MTRPTEAAEPGPGGVFQRFLHSEASGGVLLLLFAVVALAWANSPWADLYDRMRYVPIGVSAGEWRFAMSAAHWVNDGLMALFLGLKVFLTALAIADDLGAVLVIAVFYTERVNVTALAVAIVSLALLHAATRLSYRRVGGYFILAGAVWVAMLGILAASVLAGVVGFVVLKLILSRRPATAT